MLLIERNGNDLFIKSIGYDYYYIDCTHIFQCTYHSNTIHPVSVLRQMSYCYVGTGRGTAGFAFSIDRSYTQQALAFTYFRRYWIRNNWIISEMVGPCNVWVTLVSRSMCTQASICPQSKTSVRFEPRFRLHSNLPKCMNNWLKTVINYHNSFVHIATNHRAYSVFNWFIEIYYLWLW